jgi:hypothetical protein
VTLFHLFYLLWLLTSAQCIVNKAHLEGLFFVNPLEGLFELPIPAYEGAGYPIVQYADDTILVMKASQRELFILNGLLESFSQSKGLRVNYGKSCMVPLNTTNDKAQLLAGVFGCKLESLPFTYLCLPMGTTKPRVEHYGPIIFFETSMGQSRIELKGGSLQFLIF